MDAVTQLQQTLNGRRAQLEAASRLSTWRAVTGKFSPEEAAAQHGSWPEERLPLSWAPSDGAKALWHRLEVPADIAGISTSGSSLTLEVFCVIGAQVFVNGEHRYEAEFWSDSQV